MRESAIACLSALCVAASCWGLLPSIAYADYGARPNSTNLTFFDWDRDRIDIHISDETLVLNIELRRQNGPESEYFMGEYDTYRVMYNRDTHQVVVINYLNGEEIFNYDFHEVDSQVDEGYL